MPKTRGMSRPAGARAALLTAAVVGAAGCSAGPDTAAPIAQFSTTTPSWPTVTGTQILELHASLADSARRLVEVGATAAASYDLGSQVPRPADEAWTRLVAAVAATCADASGGGWRLVVTGYTDRTGPSSLNERLAQDRAQVAARLLAERTCMPAAAIDARQGPPSSGPDGPNQADRRVTVSYQRADASGGS